MADAFGWLELVVLSAWAFVAAAALAVRLGFASRAETLLCAMMLWNALVLLPIHVLGLVDQLYPQRLALASFVVSSGALACSTLGVPSRREHLRAVARSIRTSLRTPVDAIAECVRVRSPVLVGVVALLVVVAWTTWLSYLAPSDGWDGLWYHETMIGYALQQHGYRDWTISLDLAQQGNGYPRNCEMTSLWFVVFTDRRLMEVVSSLMIVPLALATYVGARRFAADRAAAMGWGAGLALVPGAVLQLRSTYLDVHVAAFAVAALHLCTKPQLRVRDAWIAWLVLALLVCSKGTALAWVPVLGLVAAGRLVWAHARRRWRATAATLAGGVALVGASASVTYLRNWIHFKNPVWPITIEVARLGIHWRGVATLDMIEARPLADVVLTLFAVPIPGGDFPDTRVYGYGPGAGFVLLPLAAAGLAAAVVVATLTAVRKRTTPAQVHDAARATDILVVAILLLLSVRVTPALWSARYNLHLVAGAAFLASYLFATLRAPRLGGALATTLCVVNLMMITWARPVAWGFTLPQALAYARIPAAERATLYRATWAMSPSVAAARERDLGPGALVLYSDVHFPALLWNERFTNRIRWVATTGEDVGKLIGELDPAWIVGPPDSDLYRAASAATERWESIGEVADLDPAPIVFRRRR
jgi:hypothetical protein